MQLTLDIIEHALHLCGRSQVRAVAMEELVEAATLELWRCDAAMMLGGARSGKAWGGTRSERVAYPRYQDFVVTTHD